MFYVHRSDGFHVEHLCFFQFPEHGSIQRIKERPGGLCRLLEGWNGQFWCEGTVKYDSVILSWLKMCMETYCCHKNLKLNQIRIETEIGEVILNSNIIYCLIILRPLFNELLTRDLWIYNTFKMIKYGFFGLLFFFYFQVSIIQPSNFSQATNIVKKKSGLDIWKNLDERRKVFNRQYMELASQYYMSTCMKGFKNADMVINAILHAVTSAQPNYRYLLASATDTFFFQLFPYLPTVLADAVFSLSSMYTKRQEMLYNK